MLMNTCAIRENAHNKVYGHLAEPEGRRHNARWAVGVLGCWRKPEGTRRNSRWWTCWSARTATGSCPACWHPHHAEEEQLTRRGLAVDLSEYETYDDILPERDGGVNAWIAIMRGCDNFCSFCVVPVRVGANVHAIRGDPAQGRWHPAIPQITLLGQNVNSLSHDDDWVLPA